MFWLNLPNPIWLKKPNSFVESAKYFIRSTKHFFVRIISKFCGWTNQNFVDSTKSFSECEINEIQFNLIRNIVKYKHGKARGYVIKMFKTVLNIYRQSRPENFC